MELLKPTINFDRFVRGLLFIAAMTIFVLVLRWLSPVLIPFFAAWAIAWILAPVVHFFQHTCRLRSRVVAVLMTLTLLTAMATVVVWLMICFSYLKLHPELEQEGNVSVRMWGYPWLP